MQKVIKENIIKNIILIVILIILYPLIQNFLLNSNLITDKGAAGDIIVVTSVIAVTACFGNFAFTYEKIKKQKSFQRFLAHFITGLFMLIIGISLIFTTILTTIIMDYFFLIDVTLLLLYLACISYDFWDLYRISLLH
jgi:hypothetical protein